LNDDLRLALRLADSADAITMEHFRSATLAVRAKADATPVSEADEAVERIIRETLARERPDDGVVGEELGADARGSRRWIIDPIDATSNYIRAIPVFATLIALEHEVGVVSAPALGRRWWASRGDGAFCNGNRIRVSPIASLDDAHLLYDSVKDFDPFGTSERFLALARRTKRTRAFGDFWSHMLVAEGAAEIAIEPSVALWDLAALQVIVEEAGGRFTDLHGDARADGGSAISSNGLLHDAALEAFR
jgi:histidinol-phosphatase